MRARDHMTTSPEVLSPQWGLGSRESRSDMPKALMEEAEEADQDGKERLKLMTNREKKKKGNEKAEATQAPKRTSMSLSDKIAKIQGRGSAGAPPPHPDFIEFKRRLGKTGGGVAERIAKLQGGTGDRTAAPVGSPPSARDRFGSSTAPRRAMIAGGARSTGGGIAARTQKLGGGPGIVLPGAFDPPPPFVSVTCESARSSLHSDRKHAPSYRRPACEPARRRTRALAHAARPAHPRRDERPPRAPHLVRCLVPVFPFSFSSVLLRFSRCWRRDEASAGGAGEPRAVGEHRRRQITGRRRRHRYHGSSHR